MGFMVERWMVVHTFLILVPDQSTKAGDAKYQIQKYQVPGTRFQSSKQGVLSTKFKSVCPVLLCKNIWWESGNSLRQQKTSLLDHFSIRSVKKCFYGMSAFSMASPIWE